ncbi:MAG: hypothetical protein ACT4PM_01845 [Gemmatimonadales bacterium]
MTKVRALVLGILVATSGCAGDTPLSVTLAVTPDVTVIDLGSRLGLDNSHARAINDRGQVVVVAYPATEGVGHGFLWSEQHGFVDLGDFGLGRVEPKAVNARGQVVGEAVVSTSASFPGFRSHAFLWTASEGMRDLTPDADFRTIANDINEAGTVVGSLERVPGIRPFVWTEQDGLMELAILPGWGATRARAINNRGQVVGEGHFPIGAPVEIRAFLWDRHTGMRDLGRLGPARPGPGPLVSALGINDRGEVVGNREDPSGALRAFLWTEEDGFVELSPPGSSSSMAADINNRGQVVSAFDLVPLPFPSILAGKPFVWSRISGFVELPMLAEEGAAGAARGINNAGDIVGDGPGDGGPAGPHAVLWKVRGLP